jgi:hypothetical protein
MSGRNGSRKAARHQHRRPTAGQADPHSGLARRVVVHLPIAGKPEQRAVFMLPAGLAFAVALGRTGTAVANHVDRDPHRGDNDDSFREWQLSVGIPVRNRSSRAGVNDRVQSVGYTRFAK